MKKYCFNYEDCGWVEYLTSEELQKIDLKNLFFVCPECKSIAAVVRNDFSLNTYEIPEPPVTNEDDDDFF